MRIIHFLLLTACLLLIAATRTAEPRDLDLPAGKTFIHANSGFSFPTQLKDFARSTGSIFDKEGNNISVAYTCWGVGAWADIYVYPTKGSTLADEFDSVQDEIRQTPQYSDVKVLEESPIKFRRNDHDYEGKSGKYSYTIELHKRVKLKVNSRTYLFVLGDNFIKFRITYDPSRKTAEKAIDAFVDAIDFPAAPTTQPR